MAVHPQIQVRNQKSGEKRVYRLEGQPSSLIGRDLSNFIILDSRAVSRKHAEILEEGGQFYLRDLKSNNGTSLNHRQLAVQEKNLLKSGDTITIGDYEMHFLLPDSDEIEDIYEKTDTDFLEVKMVKNLLKALDRDNAPILEVLEGQQAGLQFSLEGKNQNVTVGRDPACEFMVDSEVISRKHVKIEKRFDSIIIRDLNSKNGLYVNREKVAEARLKDGDIIHLGTLPLSFRNPQELAFDLEPPRASQPAGPKAAPKKDEETNPHLDAEEMKKLARPPAPPAKTAVRAPKPPETPMQKATKMARQVKKFRLPFGFSLSFTEVLTILIALTVLSASVWGILKILK